MVKLFREEHIEFELINEMVSLQKEKIYGFNVSCYREDKKYSGNKINKIDEKGENKHEIKTDSEWQLGTEAG